MIDLDHMITFEAIDKFTNESLYESLYLRDVIEFIGEDPNLFVNSKETSGYGPDVVEKSKTIL